MKKGFVLILLTLVTLGMTSYAMAQETIEERIKKLEESAAKNNHIQFSGAIEVEFKNQTTSKKGSQDEKKGELGLGNFELGINVATGNNAEGSVVLKKNDDGKIEVDEGFITITGKGNASPYVVAGKLVVPFGNYETHFVTDPVTLTLGESNIASLIAGYKGADEKFDVSLGLFNATAQEKDEDDKVDSFFASATLSPFEGFNISASYISNLAGASGLNEEVKTTDKVLKSIVAGYSAFVSYEFADRFKLTGEYIAASDSFEKGELYDTGETTKRQPKALNVEFGVAISDTIELAARYGSSDDGAEFLPETESGVVLSWGIFDNTSLSFELLQQEFEGDAKKEIDTFTTQLAIEF